MAIMERPASGFALTGATATAFALLVATVGVRSATTGNTGSSGSSVERVVVPTCRADVPPDSIKRAAELPACPDATALLNEFFGTTHPGETRPVAPLEVLVAILPDPIASHLDWAFDSSLEALRRAFERSGFVADRFWLPWMVHGDSARNRGQKLIALAEQRPGVMLFRRADPTKTDLRVVYIVGETPTSGVHKEALRRALDERRRLLGDAPLAVDSTGKVIARGDTL